MNASPPAPSPSDDASETVRPASDVGAVIIGRNEGERLTACFASLSGRVGRMVYVNSGSTDGSVAAAEEAGIPVVALDLSVPFTAARARNAGLASLVAGGRPDYVQFVDGDCTVDEAWIDAASLFLDDHPGVAVVCGRRRERFPAASVYNRLCDWEWDTPVGPAKACGGDALMRTEAVLAAGGFRVGLIAGEEPELCLRLRHAGWTVCRIDAEMTTHDAAILYFGQWWRRCRRAGFAFAQGAALHGRAPERHWVAEAWRALAWALGPPALSLALSFATPLAPLVLVAYPLQVARMALRGGIGRRTSWERAFFLTLAKFPEAVGVLEFVFGSLNGRRSLLIEYK